MACEIRKVTGFVCFNAWIRKTTKKEFKAKLVGKYGKCDILPKAFKEVVLFLASNDLHITTMQKDNYLLSMRRTLLLY